MPEKPETPDELLARAANELRDVARYRNNAGDGSVPASYVDALADVTYDLVVAYRLVARELERVHQQLADARDRPWQNQ